VLRRFGRKRRGGTNYDSVAAYEWLLRRQLRNHRGDRALAFAEAVGSRTVEDFRRQGEDQVATLRHYGLVDGMAIYDLGCGCGRTAQALQRTGWTGTYMGADIIAPFVEELRRTCPGYAAAVHREASILAADASLDLVFHWSVFTHIAPEECFLYLRDTLRALRPGGTTLFSFLELTAPHHRRVFDERVRYFERGERPRVLDAFLHRDWIADWAQRLGYGAPDFTDGLDTSRHPATWQTLARLTKPAG